MRMRCKRNNRFEAFPTCERSCIPFARLEVQNNDATAVYLTRRRLVRAVGLVQCRTVW
jgi:hypothetical protein